MKDWLTCLESAKWRTLIWWPVRYEQSFEQRPPASTYLSARHAAGVSNPSLTMMKTWRGVVPRPLNEFLVICIHDARTSCGDSVAHRPTHTHARERDWCLSNNPQLRHQIRSAPSALWQWRRTQCAALRSLIINKCQLRRAISGS